MPMNRRQFLALTGAVATATGLPPVAVAQTLQGSPALARNAAEHTTLAQRLGPGSAGELGWRPVVTLPGEPHVVRDELVAAQPGRTGRRASLLSFLHLTDQHIIDAQSPSRVEFLDRYGDSHCAEAPLSSAWRPQEAGGPRVSDAMLRRARQVQVSPVTGTPIAATICTGDNTDNQQSNELQVFLDVMDGQRVTPQSGDTTTYEGVQKLGDVAYWHPDPEIADRYKDIHGFPSRPGWLEEALAPFDAAGAGMPWYSCYGNHDGLAQGNAPVNPVFEGFGTGAAKPVALPPGANPCNELSEVMFLPGALTTAPAAQVTADPDRRYVHRGEWVARHLESPTLPHGHGFTQEHADQALAYYATDVGQIRWLVLDTVNPGGYADGSIGDEQLRWLRGQLEQADSVRRLVILFSHHGPRSLNNPSQQPDPLMPPEYSDLPRHQADAVLDVVGAHPCVIAWVNGHSHVNVVVSRETFWDIGTAAHIDWPAQARIVDVVDNRDGTLSIFTTMIDHADDPVASFARELMGNDPQKGFGKGTGGEEDRNAELLLAHPFADSSTPPGLPTEQGRPAVQPGRSLPATGLPAPLTVGGALMVAGMVGLRELRRRGQRLPM